MGCLWRNATLARGLGLPPAQRWDRPWAGPASGATLGIAPGHGHAFGDTPNSPLGKVAPAPRCPTLVARVRSGPVGMVRPPSSPLP
eukprot:8231546-Alexandrium_andersonii.AAC.1